MVVVEVEGDEADEARFSATGVFDMLGRAVILQDMFLFQGLSETDLIKVNRCLYERRYADGDPQCDPECQAQDDAASLYERLAEDVLPAYAREDDEFVRMQRSAIALNGSFFNAQRMARQYDLIAYAHPGDRGAPAEPPVRAAGSRSA